MSARADIYALGLMLNELFTGAVPHGTEYASIARAAPNYEFLDAVVAAMIRQNPAERPGSIAEVKGRIQRHRAEAVSLQKLDQIRKTVVPASEVTDPLAHEPPRLIAAEYNNGVLHLTLDRPVNENWVRALQNMGSHSSVLEAPPTAFRFAGTHVSVNVPDRSAQAAIDYFKEWLPVATRLLKHTLEQNLEQEQTRARERRRRELEAEERRLETNRTLRI